MRRLLPAVLLAAVLCPAAVRAQVPAERSGDPLAAAVLPSGGWGTPLSLASATVGSFADDRVKKPKKAKANLAQAPEEGLGLGPERARILLRSLTVPGWGQATLGHRHAAAIFGTAEVGIWVAFTAFHVQEAMRTENYLHTASLFAGIDLHGRDDEFRRIVGAFYSSDQYNLLVVTRDAANIYLSGATPDMTGYRAYIAAHSLSGRDAWSWSSLDSFDRYGGQRKDAERAGLRANTALALAIANRLASAVHAARAAAHTSMPPEPTSWNVDFQPGAPGERVLFRTGIVVRF